MGLLVACLGISACAQFAGRAAGEAVEQPLQVMTEEQNLENLESVMTSPQMARSVQGLSEAAAAGFVAGMTGPEAQQALTDAMVRSSDAIRDDVGPAVSSMVQTTVDETLTTFFSERTQAGMRQTASQVGGAMTASMMRELGMGIENEVAPAMVRAFENEVSPALVRTLHDPALRETMAMHARDLAYSTVIGTNEGIVELAERDTIVGASDLGFPGRGLTIGWAALVALFVGLGLALVAMVVLLVKGASQRRHLEEDSRRREAMFMTLVQSTLMHDATPQERREMLERLREGTGVDLEDRAATPEEPQERPRGWRQRWAWRPGT